MRRIRTEAVEGGVVYRYDQAHRCNKPEARRYDVGDVFVCSMCGTRFVLRDDQREGLYWMEEGA